MNRSKKFDKRIYKKEEVYLSVLIHRLICKTMKHGNKTTACKNVYSVLNSLEAETGKTPEEIVNLCIQKVKPAFTLRTKKIASSVFRIPVPASTARSLTIALNWIVKGARERKEKTFKDKLKSELKNIIEDGKSVALKTKETYGKIADKNKAFLHYL